MLTSLFYAVAFPVVRLFVDGYAVGRSEEVLTVGAVLVLMWLASAAVRWAAGRGESLGTMTVKVVAHAAGLVAGAVLIARLVASQYTGPEYDTLSEPHAYLFGGWALLTFIVMSLLLTSVRAGAHNIRAR